MNNVPLFKTIASVDEWVNSMGLVPENPKNSAKLSTAKKLAMQLSGNSLQVDGSEAEALQRQPYFIDCPYHVQ